jgi:hypothetical protein
MWLVFQSAIAVVISLISLARKVAGTGSVWSKLDDTKAAATDLVYGSCAEQTVPGAGTSEDQRELAQVESAGRPANTVGVFSDAAVEPAAPPSISGDTNSGSGFIRPQFWQDSHYCWVVLWKNHWFHVRQNIFFGHRIPVAQTDALASRPRFDGRFRARCDECGKEYLYRPSEVRRYEQELPEPFTPHPLFR